MSGILLPGQENEPKSEGKIELPSGYSRPEPEQPVESVEPATETADDTPESAPGPSVGQRPPAPSGEADMPDMLFPPQAAQVKCPQCGNPYVVPVFSIVDLGANPELRAPLIGGQLNVGVCQTCGAGGPLSAPLMVHDPENEFLGVYTPMQAAGDELQQQQVIGELTRTLMAKVPKDQQKGYMLQPLNFVDMQRLMERLWEFEGVTPEMLRKQREQSELLQRLVGLADDNTALDLVLERSKGLVDREFFSMLDQILVMARSQAEGNDEYKSLQLLREKLIERTEAGQEVQRQAERIQALLARVREDSSRDEILEIVLEAWEEDEGERLVGTFALATGIASDYDFLMLLAQRIEQTESDDEKERLEELRQYLVGVQEQVTAQQQQASQASAQRAQQLMQEILQATDTNAAIREHIDEIDESFLAVLAENIRRMEESGSGGAARRLMQVYQQALAVLQEQMPPDIRLVNQLVTAPDDAAARQLLRENRELVTSDFLSNLKTFEEQMRQNGRTDVADRLKSIRGQAALML